MELLKRIFKILFFIFLVGFVILVIYVGYMMNQTEAQVEYPIKEELILGLENYKNEYGNYPPSLESIGFGKYQLSGEQEFGGVKYLLENNRFNLCYISTNPTAGMACYSSDVKKWEMR